MPETRPSSSTPLPPALSLDPALVESYRNHYLADPWDFAIDICGLDLLVERFHKPIIYLIAGATDLLLEVLAGPLDSYVIRRIKEALAKKGLDWLDPRNQKSIERFAARLNIRIARKLGKTSCGEAALLWRITRNPDEAWALVSRDDPSAEEMCAFIAKLVQGAPYRFFFADRIPENERESLGQSMILLKGRTKNIPQPCITAAGCMSGWTSKHFTGAYRDDLTGLENKSPDKLKRVREFQSNLNGIKMPEVGFTFMDVTTGTRWAREDDALALDNDEDCLTIYVPAEILLDENGEEVPRTFANMMEPGVPTLPEWYDEGKLAQEKRDYMKNPDEGPVALLANIFLTIAEDAAQVFRPATVDRQRFKWHDEVDADDTPTGRRLIGRIVRTKDGAILRTFDPHRDLEIVLGVDPAVSLTGDHWGISAIGRDTYGIRYQIETVAGHGEVALIENIRYMTERWMPHNGWLRIGIEAAACQSLLTLLLSMDPQFQSMTDQIIPVPHKNQAKRLRATNLISAPLEMGELYLAPGPENAATAREMKDWNPDASNPKDGRIDSIGIGLSLFDTKASGISRDELRKQAEADDRAYQARVDPLLGIEITPLALNDDDDLDDWFEEAFG